MSATVSNPRVGPSVLNTRTRSSPLSQAQVKREINTRHAVPGVGLNKGQFSSRGRMQRPSLFRGQEQGTGVDQNRRPRQAASATGSARIEMEAMSSQKPLMTARAGCYHRARRSVPTDWRADDRERES